MKNLLKFINVKKGVKYIIIILLLLSLLIDLYN